MFRPSCGDVARCHAWQAGHCVQSWEPFKVDLWTLKANTCTDTEVGGRMIDGLGVAGATFLGVACFSLVKVARSLVKINTDLGEQLAGKCAGEGRP